MSLSITCPRCGKHYQNLKKKLAGRKVRCSCGHQMRVDGPTSDKAEATPKPNRKSAQFVAPAPSPKHERLSPAVMDFHYSDLDQILSAGAISDSPTEVRQSIQPPPAGPSSTRTSSLPAAKIPTQSESTNIDFRPSPTRSTISFLAVVASASLAFGFGSCVVAARFTEIDQFLLSRFSQTLTRINSGNFGLHEIATGLKVGFAVTGWVIWTLALCMILLAVLQFLNAVMHLFLQRQPFRWSDGLMAAMGIAVVFSFVAALFLQATFMAKLNRDLNRHDSAEAVLAGESDLANVQRIREQYSDESQQFLTVMLVAGAVPLTVFGCSMVRLLTQRL